MFLALPALYWFTPEGFLKRGEPASIYSVYSSHNLLWQCGVELADNGELVADMKWGSSGGQREEVKAPVWITCTGCYSSSPPDMPTFCPPLGRTICKCEVNHFFLNSPKPSKPGTSF